MGLGPNRPVGVGIWTFKVEIKSTLKVYSTCIKDDNLFIVKITTKIRLAEILISIKNADNDWLLLLGSNAFLGHVFNLSF